MNVMPIYKTFTCRNSKNNDNKAKSSCIISQHEDREHSIKTPCIFQSTGSAITHSIICSPLIIMQENLNQILERQKIRTINGPRSMEINYKIGEMITLVN